MHPGAAIYKKLCVECHGEKGEGVDGLADDPLYGNRDLASLTRRIERTMPEDEEDLCVGDDARSVAEYIYHAFYSEEAQIRNNPPDFELSRLTVPQYRRSVSDLVGLPFNDHMSGFPEERGLTGRYFGTRGFRGKKEKLGMDTFKQLDPVVKF
ncbi:MAG: c-type cytochrome, partial [Verrucomicrobiota bacterium]